MASPTQELKPVNSGQISSKFKLYMLRRRHYLSSLVEGGEMHPPQAKHVSCGTDRPVSFALPQVCNVFSRPNSFSKPVVDTFHQPRKFYSFEAHKNFRRTPRCAAERRSGDARPFASRAASAGLNLLIRSIVEVKGDLDVDVDASSNVDLLSGRLNGITIQAQRIVADTVPISGGCAIYVQALTLPQTEPFAVSVNATVTSGDLNTPDTKMFELFRKLMEQVLSTSFVGIIGTALQGRSGKPKAHLESITIDCDESPPGRRQAGSRLNTGTDRLLLNGRLLLGNGQSVRFTVRTALAASRDGQFLELSTPQLKWRGAGIPLLPLSRVGVALENGSKITALSLSLDGLFVEGITVVTPPPPPSQQGGLSGRGGQPVLRRQ